MPVVVTHVCPVCKGETYLPHTPCISCLTQEKLKRRDGQKHMNPKYFAWIAKTQ